MNSRCLLLKGKDYFPVRTMFGKKTPPSPIPDVGTPVRGYIQASMRQRAEPACTRQKNGQ